MALPPSYQVALEQKKMQEQIFAPAATSVLNKQVQIRESASSRKQLRDTSVPIHFTVNGQVYQVFPDEVASNYPLLSFIREKTPFRGVKRSCGEGGCGACGVAYTYNDAATGKTMTRTVNACLRPILACDGAAITTNDGLAADPTQTAAHEIQSQLAEKNGSQCGFCSNGMVMTMYGLLSRNTKPTALEIEREFDGNICRCTGYRPIMEAMKTFASTSTSADEEVEMPSCLKKGCDNRGIRVEIEDAVAHVDHHKSPAAGVVKIHGANNNNNNNNDEGKKVLKIIRPKPIGRNNKSSTHQQEQSVSTFADKMKQQQPLKTSTDNVDWIDCTTIADLNQYLSWYASLNEPVILAVAQTSQAVLPQNNAAAKLFIANIPQLNVLTQNGTGIQIGAAVTISDAITFMTNIVPLVAGGNRHFAQACLHLNRVASHLIRNVACLVGNLFLAKHAYEQKSNFQSDVIVAIFGLGATLTCYDTVQQQNFTISSLGAFFAQDFAGKYVVTINIPWCTDPNEYYMTYKVAARRVNAHAIVNAAMRASVDPVTKTIKGNPTIIFGGVFDRDMEVKNLATAFIGVNISQTANVQSFLNAAKTMLTPDTAFNNYSAQQVTYIQNVSVAYMYKFILYLLPECPSSLVSAAQAWITREVATSATHSYGPSDAQETPVNLPITKMHAVGQTSGTAEYIEDLPSAGQDTLYAYPVLAPMGNSTLNSIDSSAAQQVEGFVQIVDASVFTTLNIPNAWAGGKILAPVGSVVSYAGHFVAIILGTSKFAAEQAAKKVIVNMSMPATEPIVSMAIAIAKTQPLGPIPGAPPMTVSRGDAATVIANAKNKYTGVAGVGWQYHFHLEGHATHIIPRGGRYEVYSATQMPTVNQSIVAGVLGVPQSSVVLEQRRCGGGYGGKLTNSQLVAAAAAVCTKLTNKPIFMNLYLADYMKASGFRGARQMDYSVAWNDDGTITAFDANVYCGCGSSPEGEIGAAFVMLQSLDNCYNIPNFTANAELMILDMPAVNACRGPGWVPAIQLMESVISMVATQSGLPRDTIRSKNFYPKTGGVTPGGMMLAYNAIPDLWASINNTANIATRRTAIADFNANSKFFKKGLALVPVRFGVGQTGANFDTQINIYGDSTIAISHGGSEIGQGLNVKVAQVAAYKLGLTEAEMLANVQVLSTNTRCISAMSNVTGGSVSSELCSLSVMHACDQLNQRLQPFRGAGKTWLDVITAASGAGVHLSACGFTYAPVTVNPFNYNSYGVAAVEAEMDCLTGEYQMTRVDLLFDAGKSLNPMIDVGQIEGGFMYGCGYNVFEKVEYDTKTGAPTTASTWTYKPPSAYDTPIVWNTSLLPNAPNPLGVLSSKATGEPGVCLSSALVQALECCVEAQLQQIQGSGARFSAQMAPFSVMEAQLACGITIADMTV